MAQKEIGSNTVENKLKTTDKDAIQREKEILEIEKEAITDDQMTFENSNRYINYKPLARKKPLMYDEEYIKERLDNQIAWYDRKSSFNQKKYKKYKRLEFIIAATIPVVTTLTAIIPNDLMEKILLIFAAAGGIILVVINKMLELEDYFKFWKEYRSTCEALQYERMLYLTRAEPYDEENAFPLFVQKTESILSKETSRWQQRVKQVDASHKKAEHSEIKIK
ncbi:MAG: DUF4231 domain-containing protein [Bacteroidota bacterium]